MAITSRHLSIIKFLIVVLVVLPLAWLERRKEATEDERFKMVIQAISGSQHPTTMPSDEADEQNITPSPVHTSP